MTEGGGIAGDHLRSFVERIERLDEEISALNADKRDLYSEAKGVGFDVATIKRVVKARKVAPADRDEQDALFDLYMRTLEGTAVPAGAPARSNSRATPHDPETGEIHETDEHPAGQAKTTDLQDDAQTGRLVTEAPLASGAGAGDRTECVSARPINSQSAAAPASPAVDEGAGEPQADGAPVPSESLADAVERARAEANKDLLDIPAFLRKSA